MNEDYLLNDGFLINYRFIYIIKDHIIEVTVIIFFRFALLA